MARARRLAEAAIKEDDRNGGAYALLGEALYDQGLVAEAENLFVRALDLNPKLQRAYRLLGAVYYKHKEFAKSKQVFLLLAQSFPDDPIGYYGQAVICTELHDWSEARELVEQDALHRSWMGRRN